VAAVLGFSLDFSWIARGALLHNDSGEMPGPESTPDAL